MDPKFCDDLLGIIHHYDLQAPFSQNIAQV